MKKFLVPVLFIFAACGSDDSNSFISENEQNLRGKWQLQSILRNGAPYNLEECWNQNTVDFKDSGAYLQLDYGMPSGSTTCAVDSLTSGSYEFANDSIYFTINTYTDTLFSAALLEVNQQTLRLNSRMYKTADEEGSDEITFTRVVQ